MASGSSRARKHGRHDGDETWKKRTRTIYSVVCHPDALDVPLSVGHPGLHGVQCTSDGSNRGCRSFRTRWRTGDHCPAGRHDHCHQTRGGNRQCLFQCAASRICSACIHILRQASGQTGLFDRSGYPFGRISAARTLDTCSRHWLSCARHHQG